MTIALHDVDGEHSLTLSDLTQLKTALEPLISSPAAVGEVVARAKTAGFEFDD